MNKLLLLLLTLSIQARGEFELWTDAAGRTAEMELVSVSETNGTSSGVFRLKNGKQLTIDSTKFSNADSKKIAAWKPSDIANKGIFVRAQKGENVFPDTPPEDSVVFTFTYSGKNVIGVKKNSLSIISCTLAPERKIVASPAISELRQGSDAPIISDPVNAPQGFDKKRKEAWELQPTLTSNERTGKNELSLGIALKHGKDYLENEIQDSKFSANVVVAIGSALKAETIHFKRTEVGRKHAKSFGSCSIWLEEQNQDPFKEETPDSPKTLFIFTEEPYDPGCVKSCQLLSNGKPIEKLAESSSAISVSIEYWADIKNVTVRCEK